MKDGGGKVDKEGVFKDEGRNRLKGNELLELEQRHNSGVTLKTWKLLRDSLSVFSAPISARILFLIQPPPLHSSNWHFSFNTAFFLFSTSSA